MVPPLHLTRREHKNRWERTHADIFDMRSCVEGQPVTVPKIARVWRYLVAERKFDMEDWLAQQEAASDEVAALKDSQERAKATRGSLFAACRTPRTDPVPLNFVNETKRRLWMCHLAFESIDLTTLATNRPRLPRAGTLRQVSPD